MKLTALPSGAQQVLHDQFEPRGHTGSLGERCQSSPSGIQYALSLYREQDVESAPVCVQGWGGGGAEGWRAG